MGAREPCGCLSRVAGWRLLGREVGDRAGEGLRVSRAGTGSWGSAEEDP